MHVQAYQIFSVAVALATLLLVEMPSNADMIRADIELVIEDLHFHNMSVEAVRRVPLISDGSRVIRRILGLYDARCKHQSSTQQDEAPTSLVPAISYVFGGESSARRYLERCSIDYINGDTATTEGGNLRNSYSGISELAVWDALLDPVQSGQLDDGFWLDLDAYLGLNAKEVGYY